MSTDKENLNFCAVDFETATNTRMACQVGITVVEHGEIIETIVRLIQPPHNHYDMNTVHVHHIKPELTANVPTFDVLWPEISKYFVGRIVVAHNAAFDEDVLWKNLEYYNIMPMGIMPFFCTYQIYGYSLTDLCEAFSICCDEHHDAGFDSRCCAQFFLNFKNGVMPNLSMIKKPHKKVSRGKHAQLKGDVLKQDLTEADPNNPFYDRKVVITGTFPMERREMGNILKSMGADINTSISKRTNFVLIGEDPGPSKIEKIDKLIHDGYNIKKLSADDFQKILDGEWDSYKTEKQIAKDLDFTYEHYVKHHISFDGMKNVIASKELYYGKGFAPMMVCFMQIAGNLGAFGNSTLDADVNICVLSDSTLEKLKNGEKDETILYIQDFYNSNKSITFDYSFMSENDILEYCKMRCDAIGDEVTLSLYDRYMESKRQTNN